MEQDDIALPGQCECKHFKAGHHTKYRFCRLCDCHRFKQG